MYAAATNFPKTYEHREQIYTCGLFGRNSWVGRGLGRGRGCSFCTVLGYLLG